MTINIMNQYIKITKKEIETYMKLVFDKKFIKEYNDIFVDKYIKIRYYNFYDNYNYLTIRKKILIILRETAENLIIDNINDRILIEQMCTFFYYNLYFDNVVYYKDLKEKIKKIAKLRKRILKVEEKEFEKKLYNEIINFTNQKKELLKHFDSKYFEIVIKSYPDKRNIYRVNLKNNIKIPLVYSEYAKNKAFNIGLINEDKLKVEYYLVVIKIIKDIIKLNFKRQYILEFAETLLKKEQKINNVLSILDNGVIQEKVCLKIRYEFFYKNKEKIINLMRKGYKFAIIIDSSLECNYRNIELLDIFKFIIINKEQENYEELIKILNTKIKNKIIEI